jgi:hypothetical protein
MLHITRTGPNAGRLSGAGNGARVAAESNFVVVVP